MVDLDLLREKYGLTDDLLKSKFQVTINPNPEPGIPAKELPADEKIAKVRNRIRHRIQAGRNNNIANHKLYHALDLAWDLPFKQVNPTLLRSLLDKNLDGEEVMNTMKSWGLDADKLISEIDDPKSEGKKIKQLNIPAFFEIWIPLVRAYVTIRLAKLMNDRLQVPLFKYDPAINSARNRLQCDVVTNRIERMNRDYGYYSVMKQAVFQMLHYSLCLMFPVEEWHKVEHMVRDDEKVEDKTTATQEGVDKMMGATGGLLGEQVEDAEAAKDAQAPDDNKIKVKKKIVKEGLRYHMPHPARMFFDEAHRISTINTDTGCSFAGYWRVFRYSEIRDNADFWNTDKVRIGDTEWWTSYGTFWSTIFSGCAIKPPQTTANIMVQEAGNDRESKMVYEFYTMDHDDASVIVTEYFEKLVPKDYGLGTYEYPVWFRFVVASDDTILYCAPVPYCPVVAFVYDADEARAKNPSLSLEVLPFQDQISNLLTQFILSARANLSNATFVDSDVVEKGMIDKLKNLGEKLWRGRNFLPFSGRKAQKSQQGIPTVFISHHFPNIDTSSIIQAIRMILDMLERVLVMSSQEVGQAASHELREKEVMNIQNSTSTRLQFTGTNVDLGEDAWKNQMYQADMAYGSPEFEAEVPNDPQITPEMLENLGFSFVQEKGELPVHMQKKIRVKVRRTAISLANFTSSREGFNRADSKDSVLQLANALQGWLANPILGPAIGPDQGIHMVNLIGRMAGFPKEFKLENSSGNQALQAELQKFISQIEEKIMGDIQKGLKPMMDLDLQQQQDIQQMKQMLGIPPTPPQPSQYDSAQSTGAPGVQGGAPPEMAQQPGSPMAGATPAPPAGPPTA